ncbi:YbhB/YbcL family Raf kinase inhibitor-like protein [Acidianus sp. RZ1]|uniref:YbhB/YbcL family Raf kinase inhibitor-like protein n=1 Tax=Acidianus sp. RZ1 TaxID=1540082 RepID=UPI0014919392|nr:YbhB/YbcL family Raf kinase inhibitor-like protein [Acidianus sp. RZ1]NON61898.1 YbhB/YbcL family Raf kinase inhibitor-like protein [Acidianus sp. RZ1]
MEIKSPSFKNEDIIPRKYTCDGEDYSPSLSWNKVSNASSYAIIVEDPDAPGGVFIHWIIYNIKENSLPENVPKKEKTDFGIQGINDFDNIGYNGPCPPRGHGFHRYYFNVYALSQDIPSSSKITAKELKEKMAKIVIDSGSLMGKYKRT